MVVNLARSSRRTPSFQSRAGVCDTYDSGVWEPTINKRNSLRSATEAACLILSIDETVKNPQVGLAWGWSLFGAFLPPRCRNMLINHIVYVFTLALRSCCTSMRCVLALFAEFWSSRPLCGCCNSTRRCIFSAVKNKPCCGTAYANESRLLSCSSVLRAVSAPAMVQTQRLGCYHLVCHSRLSRRPHRCVWYLVVSCSGRRETTALTTRPVSGHGLYTIIGWTPFFFFLW